MPETPRQMAFYLFSFYQGASMFNHLNLRDETQGDQP